jgi:predicted Rossmann-fold nucleotide-binding protein
MDADAGGAVIYWDGGMGGWGEILMLLLMIRNNKTESNCVGFIQLFSYQLSVALFGNCSLLPVPCSLI